MAQYLKMLLFLPETIITSILAIFNLIFTTSTCISTLLYQPEVFGEPKFIGYQLLSFTLSYFLFFCAVLLLRVKKS